MPQTDKTLDILARADDSRLKAFAETLLPELGEIEVLKSRTGLVMLPMRDTAQATAFHLGEVLVSEAHIRSAKVEAYGMRRGRDLEASMAMALVDLALLTGVKTPECEAFCAREAEDLQNKDTQTLCRIEATRVDMETF